MCSREGLSAGKRDRLADRRRAAVSPPSHVALLALVKNRNIGSILGLRVAIVTTRRDDADGETLMDDYETRGFGGRMRRLREERGMTQDEIANLLGTTKSAVSRVESGQRGLAAAELAALSSALEVSADFILFGEAPSEAMLRADADATDALAYATGIIEDFEYLEALTA